MMDGRGTGLWVLAMVGVLALSTAALERQINTGASKVDLAPESAPRWQDPVPDLQSIHMHPGLATLVERVDADPRIVAAVLDPKRVAAVQASCPPRAPELIILCEPDNLQPLIEEVDQVLLDALGDPEDAVAMWAVELLVFKGAKGAEIAQTALLAEDAHYGLDRQKTMAVHVLARALPRPQALKRLRECIDMSAPVAAMAALELARLGATDAREDLSRAESRLSNTVEGLVVTHAVGLLDQVPPKL